jgi:hypothetical protein
VFYFIDDIILLMLKLVSNKIDTYLTSLWRHERYLFSYFVEFCPRYFDGFRRNKAPPQSCTRKIFYQIIKINKTQILLKYFFGARGVKFLEKRRENVQIFQALRWRFDIWEAIFAVKTMVCRHVTVICKCKIKIK